jgi:hypothetical protein
MGAAWGLREAQESDTSEKRQSVWWKRTVGATHLSLLQSLVPFLDSWGSAALHPGGNVSAYRRLQSVISFVKTSWYVAILKAVFFPDADPPIPRCADTLPRAAARMVALKVA